MSFFSFSLLKFVFTLFHLSTRWASYKTFPNYPENTKKYLTTINFGCINSKTWFLALLGVLFYLKQLVVLWCASFFVFFYWQRFWFYHETKVFFTIFSPCFRELLNLFLFLMASKKISNSSGSSWKMGIFSSIESNTKRTCFAFHCEWKEKIYM